MVIILIIFFLPHFIFSFTNLSFWPLAYTRLLQSKKKERKRGHITNTINCTLAKKERKKSHTSCCFVASVVCSLLQIKSIIGVIFMAPRHSLLLFLGLSAVTGYRHCAYHRLFVIVSAFFLFYPTSLLASVLACSSLHKFSISMDSHIMIGIVFPVLCVSTDFKSLSIALIARADCCALTRS